MHVLFLCTHNACRSIMAEALFNTLAPHPHTASSAGSAPSGQVNAQAVAYLQRQGIAVDQLQSQGWDHLPVPDVVITVCDQAAAEACPLYLGQAVRGHWGMADPSRPARPQTALEQAASFDQAGDLLKRRIQAFLALPLEQLQRKPDQFSDALNQIGQTVLP